MNVRRDEVHLEPSRLIAHGHYGRAALVLPSEQGRAEDFESNGMVDAVADLIEAGRVKLYCVDSADGYTWSDRSVPIEERARRHGEYERGTPRVVEDAGEPAARRRAGRVGDRPDGGVARHHRVREAPV